MPKILVWGTAALALLAGACKSKTPDTTVAVTGTDAACTAATTQLQAGTIRFQLTNKSRLTNELYVLDTKNRVVKEVEDIIPGGSGHLDVTLKAGNYTLNCKPGQTGAGFRQAVSVA